jgi:hypothetical protein
VVLLKGVELITEAFIGFDFDGVLRMVWGNKPGDTVTISWGESEAVLKQFTQASVHVILLSCSPLYGFPGKKVYKDKPSKQTCIAVSRELGGSHRDALQLFAMTGPDLNQIKVQHRLLYEHTGFGASFGTLKDSTPHAYFDTLKLLRGVSVPDDSVNLDWTPQPLCHE